MCIRDSTLSRLAQTSWMDVLPIPVCIKDKTSPATELQVCHVLRRTLGKLVCVGDDKLLPPVVKQIKVRGILDRSLMERVRGRAGIKIFMLETQYRSHWTIMQFSSSRFYHGRLECGRPSKSCPWPAGIRVANEHRIIFRM